jgi:Repeat of unknown function (DUF5648)
MIFLRSILASFIIYFSLIPAAQAQCVQKQSTAFLPYYATALTEVARYTLYPGGGQFLTNYPAAELGQNWCVNSGTFYFQNNFNYNANFSVSAQPFSGGAPVYRFRNSQNGGYFYTISYAEFLYVQTNLPAFLYEGVAWYAGTSQTYAGSIPVYRYRTQLGMYGYTADAAELAGYISEGVAFYAWRQRLFKPM